MHIQRSKITNNKTGIQRKSQSTDNIETIKKNAMRALYKKACLEVPDEGKFEDVAEKILNPNTDETYYLSVSHAYNDKKPWERTVNISYTTNEDAYISTIAAARGSKQDILDFLGNEKNLETITYYIDYLRKKTALD